MGRILFQARCGDDTWEVDISQPSGAAGTWYILIDKYFHGQMWKRNGRWEGGLTPKSPLTYADIQILGEIIEENVGE